MLLIILSIVVLLLYVIMMEVTLHYLASESDRCTVEYACKIAASTIWPYTWFLIGVAAVLNKIRKA